MYEKDKTVQNNENKKDNDMSQEIIKAEKFLKQNNIPEFHQRYTL